MHSATEIIWGATSCNTLVIARSLRLSALGSVTNAKSSSVNFSSSERKRKMLDTGSTFHHNIRWNDNFVLFCYRRRYPLERSCMYYDTYNEVTVSSMGDQGRYEMPAEIDAS